MPQIPIPQPTQQQATPEIMTEQLRRRAELGPSGVGAAPPPGASQQPQLTPQPGQPGGGGAGGLASAGAAAGLKEQKSEAQVIESALIARLKALGDRGE